MTDSNPSLVARLAPITREFGEPRDESARKLLRELAAYLREIPTDLANGIGLAIHQVGDFPAKTYLTRCGKAAAAALADHLEKEAQR